MESLQAAFKLLNRVATDEFLADFADDWKNRPTKYIA